MFSILIVFSSACSETYGIVELESDLQTYLNDEYNEMFDSVSVTPKEQFNKVSIKFRSSFDQKTREEQEHILKQVKEKMEDLIDINELELAVQPIAVSADTARHNYFFNVRNEFTTNSNSSPRKVVNKEEVYSFMKDQYNKLTNYGESYIPEIHDDKVDELASKKFGITKSEASRIYIEKEMNKYR